MSDFQAKARAAAANIALQNPAEALAKSLTNDVPKIDAAVKSYMALVSARIASSARLSSPNAIELTTDRDSPKCYFVNTKNAAKASLLCARRILQKVNAFEIPEFDQKNEEGKEETSEEQKLEYNVVRILWNGIIKNGTKPSRVLGKQSLIHVYPLLLDMLQVDIPNEVDEDEWKSFMIEFGQLLKDSIKRGDANVPLESREKMNMMDDDSCLLWDVDGGKEELNRRRDRRKSNAQSAKEEAQAGGSIESITDSLTIEEIKEEDDEK